MKIEEKSYYSFENYEDSLCRLESAFNAAKLPVKFYLFMAPLNNKMVEITYRNQSKRNLVCIEGASPAQAVKDIAKGVWL